MDINRELRLDHISFYVILKDLIKNFWMIILAMISASLLLSSWAMVGYKPEYRSTATFVISARGTTSAYTSLNMAQEMTAVFANVFKSNILKEKVASEIGVEKLDGRITTQVIPQTNLMKVSVTADSPETAFRTLQLVLENYGLVADYIFENAILDVIKEPIIPYAPSNSIPTSSRQKLYSLMAGGVVFCGIVALSILRDTVQNASAARHKLDGEMIASIPHEVKNKTKRWKIRRNSKKSAVLITNPLVSFHLIEAYQSLCAKLEYRAKRSSEKETKVLLVTSASENEGKTTVASNLALALSKRKYNVLLVDCDFRKPAMQKIFDTEVGKANDFSEYLEQSSNEEIYPITFISNLNVVFNKGMRAGKYFSVTERMRQFIEEERQKRDYIVIDSPPMLVASDAEALASLADLSILVVRQDFTMTGDINDCLDLLKQSSGQAVYIYNNYKKIFGR